MLIRANCRTMTVVILLPECFFQGGLLSFMSLYVCSFITRFNFVHNVHCVIPYLCVSVWCLIDLMNYFLYVCLSVSCDDACCSVSVGRLVRTRLLRQRNATQQHQLASCHRLHGQRDVFHQCRRTDDSCWRRQYRYVVEKIQEHTGKANSFIEPFVSQEIRAVAGKPRDAAVIVQDGSRNLSRIQANWK